MLRLAVPSYDKRESARAAIARFNVKGLNAALKIVGAVMQPQECR